MSFDDASTLGVGITTVGQALYQSLGLPLPFPDSNQMAGFPILIYGASTATGTLAVQFAKLSGCNPIIATCSPHNFDLARSRGADVVLDYKQPDIVARIKDAANDNLKHALDCISNAETAQICSNSISPAGGMVSYLLGIQHERKDVKVGHTFGYTVTGEYFTIRDREWPANAEDLEFGKRFWELAERLAGEGKIRAHPVEVGEKGLEGIFEGLKTMRERRVSGRKLVYRVEEAERV